MAKPLEARGEAASYIYKLSFKSMLFFFTDIKKIVGFPIPLLIIGSKYDIFQVRTSLGTLSQSE